MRLNLALGVAPMLRCAHAVAYEPQILVSRITCRVIVAP
jgi:hypothetical protein